jgi:rubrerythrin
MSKKEHHSEQTKEIKVTDKKIQFGETENICFACGEKIDPNIEVCPFCNTKQDKKS